MKTAWQKVTKASPDKKDDFKEAWADSANFREFLIELLEARIKAERESQERDAYDIENWALKQADSNGVIRTYKEVIGLLDK